MYQPMVTQASLCLQRVVHYDVISMWIQESMYVVRNKMCQLKSVAVLSLQMLFRCMRMQLIGLPRRMTTQQMTDQFFFKGFSQNNGKKRETGGFDAFQAGPVLVWSSELDINWKAQVCYCNQSLFVGAEMILPLSPFLIQPNQHKVVLFCPWLMQGHCQYACICLTALIQMIKHCVWQNNGSEPKSKSTSSLDVSSSSLLFVRYTEQHKVRQGTEILKTRQRKHLA